MARKKVLLMVIDALTPRVFKQAMESGKLPNFKSIWDRGELREDYCSVFPSITHACLSSIATGHYPIEHGVLGTIWHDKEEGDSAYYGAQLWLVLNQGVNKFLEDLIWKLNEKRLKQPTIFEKIEESGLKAACLNHLIYRGLHERDVHQPFLLKIIPFVKTTKHLRGPSIFFLGDFIRLEIDGEEFDIDGGASRKFGMADPCTVQALHIMADKKAFPDFTLVYFPDNDVMSHKEGPDEAVSALEELDKELGEFLEKMGGVDRFLEEFCILIHGDHAQTDMKEDGGIVMDKMLEDYDLIRPGDELEKDGQLLIAPNLRTCFIYFYEPTSEKLHELASVCLKDERIDQVMWQSDLYDQDSKGFVVLTRDRGSIRFWNGEQQNDCARDDFGNCWSWEGDPSALDFSVEAGRLKWGSYPNAFERIACGLGPKHAGHLWITAANGFGFRLKEMGAHEGGGSHGSLSAGDSLTALLVAGLPAGVEVPEHARIVDTAPLILKILGLSEDGLAQPRFKQGMEAYAS